MKTPEVPEPAPEARRFVRFAADGGRARCSHSFESMSYPRALAGRRVLVVDDDEMNQRLLCTLFQAEQCLVHRACSYDLATMLAWDLRPDIVLVKLEIERGRGLDLIARLRSLLAVHEVHVFGMTADTAGFSERVVLAAGCEARVVIPIDTRTLAQRLTDALAPTRHP